MAKKTTKAQRAVASETTVSETTVSATSVLPPITARLTDDVLPSVAELAYRRFLARGSVEGRDQEDWFEAERERQNLERLQQN